MTLNVAFYGAGSRAAPYLQALARMPEVHVAAVCDPDRRAAEQTAAGWGAAVYESYEVLLQEARPDALWVCVPPPLQGGAVLQAAQLRVPFFTDPPGDLDYARARRCGLLVADAGLVTAVGFSARSVDLVREARDYLGDNPVPVALAQWLSPPSDEAAAPGTALLWADACSFVDALRFFCGEATRVRALSAGGEERAVVVQLEFAGGTVGVLTCASFARQEPRVELELLGEGWSVGFGAGFRTLRLEERDRTTLLRRLNDPAADQAAQFVQATAAGDPAAVAVSYPEAVKTLSVCQAAACSVGEGRPVTVADAEADVTPA